jgi:acetamidase/formamidase
VQHFDASDLKYTYSLDHDPIGTVRPGERFVIETEDCFTGLFREPGGFTPENLQWALDNLDGVTGPVFVEGASPGDVVAITLHSVEVTTPGSVALAPLNADSPRDWWAEWYAAEAYPIEDGHIVFNDDIRIPVAPLIGCIATAPAVETVYSKMQGKYGGNMDANEVREGATLILPVAVDGGFVYFGDSKAAMGDGEVVQSPEVGTRIEATIEVGKKPDRMNWPRVESPTHLTTLVSGLTIDDAAAIAFAELLAWCEEHSGLDREQTSMILAMVAHTGICQIANTLHTAKATVARDALPWKMP